MKQGFYLVIFIINFAFSSISYGAEKRHYTISTGSVGATYYPVGKAICNLVNNNNLDFTCEAIASEGSIYNLNAVQNKIHDFAISQNIMQYDSYLGINKFQNNGANKDLRIVTPLHVETMVIAVNKKYDVNSFEDLKNFRVNIGNVGSGTRVILDKLFEHKNISYEYFSEIHSAKASELEEMFCNDNIDAAIYSTGHPNKIYERLISNCNVKIVSLFDKDIKEFINKNKEYVKASLPSSIYKGQNKKIKAFGIATSLSALKTIPNEHIESLLALLQNNKKILEKENKVFKSISFKRKNFHFSAPYHEGSN
jgi:TRAP transporter TAXI family solute receptor